MKNKLWNFLTWLKGIIPLTTIDSFKKATKEALKILLAIGVIVVAAKYPAWNVVMGFVSKGILDALDFWFYTKN